MPATESFLDELLGCMLSCTYGSLTGSMSNVEYLVVDNLQPLPCLIEIFKMVGLAHLMVRGWLQNNT